jgi:hypothetical protein
LAKCLYVGTECMLEKKGKCGQSAKCPYARKLMAEKKVKGPVGKQQDKKEVHRKSRQPSDKNRKSRTK